MICLSRSDKNPFKVDERIKERTNYNSLNISHGTLYCNGERQAYKLEDLCNYDYVLLLVWWRTSLQFSRYSEDIYNLYPL